MFGPVGDDGYYKPLYDKAIQAAIDPDVATYWRDFRYDLRYILQRDWEASSPRSSGARFTLRAARWTTAI